MAPIATLTEEQLRQVCAVLGDTAGGLTGSEIGRILAQLAVEDPYPTMTKRERLFEALVRRQRADGCGNLAIAFIRAAMDPVRYSSTPDVFAQRRDDLNRVLAFCGYFLGEDGAVHVRPAVSTLSEAAQRATRLRTALVTRGVHADVLAFCREEFLADNYFHAVFEATKSVAEKVRRLSGLDGDGGELVDRAFGLGGSGMPVVAFNSLRTEVERGEHRGLMNLLKGMFGAFRNVAAHAPRAVWTVTEQDALDLLTLASLLHRRLDAAVRTVSSA